MKLILLILTLGYVQSYPRAVVQPSNNNQYIMRQNPGFYYYYPNQYYYQYPNYQMPQAPTPPPQNVGQQGLESQKPPGSGCSGNYACASACLQNQYNYGNGWYYPQYNQISQATEVPTDEESTTAQPVRRPETAGCQYSDCTGSGYYGYSCGLRVGYNYGNSICGSTGGWPSSYCGNDWSYTPYCDANLCSNDCRSLQQSGGYCDDGKCYCFRQMYSPQMASAATSAPDSSANGN